MVESKEEVDKILELIKYPPLGKRTFGLNRAQGYGFNFQIILIHGMINQYLFLK